MASSGRYRSNVFNFLSRQSMRLQDQVNRTWRQAKMTATWGAQILLYPLYVGFQATRLMGKQLSQTAQRIVPKLRAVAQPVAESELVFADTPIQRSLQALSDFALLLPADRLALQLDPQDPSAPGIWIVVGGAIVSSSRLLEAGSLTASNQSSLESSPQATIKLVVADSPTKLERLELERVGLERVGKLQASERSAVIQIQGIASLLNSHRLVLVDAENQLLDVLSLEQQMGLQQRIAGDVAGYWRQQRRLAKNQWVDRLPLPKERTLALPPIRAFWQLMTWMQTSPVAVATNLFQESKLLPPLVSSSPAFSSSASSSPISSFTALRSAETSWKTGNELLENLSRWFHDRQQRFAPVGSSDRKASSALIKTSPPEKPDNLPQNLSLISTWIRRSPAPNLAAMRASLLSGSSSSASLLKTASPGMTSAEKAAETSELLAPSWLEAEVRLVTYEKHPVEQLFDWLDRGMLWVEDRMVDLWKWLRDRWSA